MKFKQIKITEIADHVGGTLEGDADLVISGVNGLADAASNELSFLANPKYIPLLQTTKAGCVLVRPGVEVPEGLNVIRAENPDMAFTLAVEAMIEPLPKPAVGIHETAVISPEAKLGVDVTVGPYCVIDAGAVVGDRTVLHAGCKIGFESIVGSDCEFLPNVVVCHRVTIGDRVILHPGAVIGSDGFGYAWDGKSHRKIPQVGTVEIGNDVEIGVNTVVDRARFGKTVIGDGSKLDNLIQIAHNVEIGPLCAFAAQVGIAGSTKVGQGVLLGGKVGVIGHLEIAPGTQLSALSGVTKSIGPGHYTAYPAKPHKQYIDEARNIKAISKMRKQLKEMERRIAELEA